MTSGEFVVQFTKIWYLFDMLIWWYAVLSCYENSVQREVYWVNRIEERFWANILTFAVDELSVPFNDQILVKRHLSTNIIETESSRFQIRITTERIDVMKHIHLYSVKRNSEIYSTKWLFSKYKNVCAVHQFYLVFFQECYIGRQWRSASYTANIGDQLKPLFTSIVK